jgi:hypothetical protein
MFDGLTFVRPILRRKIPIPQQSQCSGPQAVCSETKLGGFAGCRNSKPHHLARATQTCFRSLQHPCLVTKCTIQHLWAASGPAWNLPPSQPSTQGDIVDPQRCSRQSETTKMVFPSRSHCTSLEHLPPATNRGSYPGLRRVVPPSRVQGQSKTPPARSCTISI